MGNHYYGNRKMIRKKALLNFSLLVFATFLYLGESSGQISNSKNSLLNVKANKAIGDGISDDTKAIQETINQATKGDTVYIPEGKYLVRVLGLKSDVHIKGEG